MANPDLILYPDIMQGTDEWHAARCGMLTASVVGQLLTPTLQVADNATSRTLLHTLAAERITGHIDPVPISADMWRGVDDEPRARDAYTEHHAPVTEIGFMVRHLDGYQIGYSPDGLVGDDGLIEIKSRRPKHHLASIIADTVPPEHMAQIQCGLLVSGRDWLDYVSYSGGMPLWVKRVTPDPDWTTAIRLAAQMFEQRMTGLLNRYQQATAGLPMTERTPDYAELEIQL